MKAWHAAWARNANSRRALLAALPVTLAIVACGCVVGPNYHRPAFDLPQNYKEDPNWQLAQPADAKLGGNWWELFGDPQLSSLEAQVTVSNQSLKAAQAQFNQARALVRYYRAGYYPTLSVAPYASGNHISNNKPEAGTSAGATYADLAVPFDVSWEPDIWGLVRRTVQEARANAQASAAELAAVQLSLQSELAVDYFQLRTLDADAQLLDSTVGDYTKALDLTKNRHEGGVASEVDVAQAETQLETTRAEAQDVHVARAQYEHAIAVLIGKPPEEFSIASAPLEAGPPAIPAAVPSQILERRPDVAEAERNVAAANAGIGVAKAAYYPAITLSADGGFESGKITNLISGPSTLWSVGASALETIFDAGRRHAANQQAWAVYDQAVANYRQSVLTAFQEVEDNLAALRILEQEAATQDAAVAAAQHSLSLSVTRYRGGVTGYLEVTTAQSSALADERVAVDLRARRMTAAVLLIKALGGGWDAASLQNITYPSSPATSVPPSPAPAASSTQGNPQ
ncbi:MAG: efflux transporter outer membrane subunit [Candidatus Acidiferrales bacterium]|jgi:NodT family efflux transporter outer membrane factor (OMF) lipoprotein